MEAEKVIKETKVKIESDYPALAKLINGWPDHYGSEKRAIWDMVWLAFDFGFGQGLTAGLEQSLKATDFAMDMLGMKR